MFTFITGGSASGKSKFAEDSILSCPKSPRIYIATMQPMDEECRNRIYRHRVMRAGKGFTTLECYTGLNSIVVPKESVVLLECISNLIANEIYRPDGAGETGVVAAVLEGIRSLLDQCYHLIVVSNEVNSGGVEYDSSTMRYLEILGEVNQSLVKWSQNAVEITAGIPVWHKKGW